MEVQNKQLKKQQLGLLNANQNKRIISIQIEKFFTKSHLKLIELSYEE